MMKEIMAYFFSDGSSIYRNVSTKTFMFANFMGDEINHEDFSLAAYMAQHMSSKVRMYLLSKVNEGE